MNKKIIITNSNKYLKKLEKLNSNSIFFEWKNEKEIFKEIKKNKAKSAIILNKDGSIKLLTKKDGSWKSENDFLFEMLFMEKLGIKPEHPKHISNKIPFGKPSNKVVYKGNSVIYSENIINKYFDERINFYLSGTWNEELNNFKEKYGTFKFSHKRISKDRTPGLEVFKWNLSNGKLMSGIGKTKVNREEKNDFLFSNARSNTAIISNKETYDLMTITMMKEEIELFYYHKNYFINIFNNIELKKVQAKKIRKKDIAISLIGMVIFIILSYFTFTTIIDPKNAEGAIDIIFNKTAWVNPWIYLLWLNFIVTFFYSFLVAYFTFYLTTRKRPKINVMWAFFVASQIRATVKFITGEAIIGTIIWGIYIIRNSQIKVSNLVGTVAIFSAVSGIFIMIFGIPFMIVGQFYAVDIFNYGYSLNHAGAGADLAKIIWFYILAWGGFVYSILHYMFIPIAVFIYPVHFLYNIIYTRVSMIKNPNNVIRQMEAREMSLLNFKKSYKTLFKNKDRFIRICVITIGVILFEAFESMFVFNIAEDGLRSNGVAWANNTYYNLAQLSGIRLMISNIYNFPVVNLIPGNGMGVIEFFKTDLNKLIFIFEHKDTIDLLANQDVINNFAQQSAFLTRFFNVYLRRIISLGFTMFIVAQIVYRKLSKSTK